MRCHVNLSDVAADIRDGDLLLFRGRGTVARMIGVAGRSDYTHAARAVWWGNDLFCCEVRELKGGRAVMLESQVRKFPSAIDVFEVNPSGRWREYDRRGAVRFIRRLAGCDFRDTLSIPGRTLDVFVEPASGRIFGTYYVSEVDEVGLYFRYVGFEVSRDGNLTNQFIENAIPREQSVLGIVAVPVPEPATALLRLLATIGGCWLCSQRR